MTEFTEILEKLGNPLNSYNGRSLEIVTLNICVLKNEAKIQKYTFNGEECNEWEDSIRDKGRWRFIWTESPMPSDMFSMYVRSVYDSPAVDYYYVTIWLSDNMNIDAFKKYTSTPEKINWEDLLLPWKKYDRYTYA
jgi:hypothetical protein